MALTVLDALDFMSIDYADEFVTRKATRALATGYSVAKGAVGEDVETYLPGDPRFDELVLRRTDEAYNDRPSKGKEGSAESKLIALLETQLRLDLREAKEKAGVKE